MFKTIDLQGLMGPIKNAWLKLNRYIQTHVEHARVINSTANPIGKGILVYQTTTPKQIAPAIGTSAAAAEVVGVMAEPMAANGQAVMRTHGYAYVKFETDLSLTEGTPAFLSATAAGCATDNSPNPSTAWVSKLGIIADATGYSNANPYAYVVLGNCCMFAPE
jgi:hypothetical protein